MKQHLILLGLFAIAASARTVATPSGDSDWAANAPAMIAGDPGAHSDAGPAFAYNEAKAWESEAIAAAPDLGGTLEEPRISSRLPSDPPCSGTCDIPEPSPAGLLPSGLLALYLIRRLFRSLGALSRA
jgi:hypothetical protein